MIARTRSAVVLAPSSAGIARMGEFLGALHRTSSSVLWILLMAKPAAVMVLERLGFADRVPTSVALQPMSADELRRMLTARHQLSGFTLEYEAPPGRLIDRVVQLRPPPPSEVFHARLHRHSGGNPRQALYAWQVAARVDPSDDGRIVLRSPPANAPHRLEPLPLDQRLILALLAQHGSMSDGDLAEALVAPRLALHAGIGSLRSRGLLVPSREHADHWTLPPILAHPIVMELRSHNMI